MQRDDNLLVALFNFCWQVLQHEFTYRNFTFTLWDVCKVTLILCISGYTVGKIIFMRKDN